MRAEYQGIDISESYSKCCICGEIKESTGILMCDSACCENVLFEDDEDDHECNVPVMCECGNFYCIPCRGEWKKCRECQEFWCDFCMYDRLAGDTCRWCRNP